MEVLDLLKKRKRKNNDWTDNYDIQERKGVRLFTIGTKTNKHCLSIRRILFYTSQIVKRCVSFFFFLIGGTLNRILKVEHMILFRL